jgi:putative tryptophan/tyrosine transport system substrate-binding protein
VRSLAQPGANVTGLSLQTVDLAGKRLELVREVLPDLRRLGIVVNNANLGAMLETRQAEAAARTLGLDVTTQEIQRAEDVASAVAALKGRVGALYLVDDPLTFLHRVNIISLALDARLPTVHRQSRRYDVVWTKLPEPVASRRRVRRQDPTRDEACRHPRRAAH